MSTKLKFVIKKGSIAKFIKAYLITEGEMGDNYSVRIDNNILKLFDFAVNYSIKNNIKFTKKQNINKGIVSEIITFDDGDYIIDKFNKNLIIDKGNNYVINKKLVAGVVLGLVGITSLGHIIFDSNDGSNVNTDKDENNIEQDGFSVENNFTAGISKVFASNPDFSSLDVKFDVDTDIDDNNIDNYQSSANDQKQESNSANNNIDLFSFEYSDRSKSEYVSKAKSNMETLNKYGNRYGIDPNLLVAIFAAESNGTHVDYSQNGCAIGAFQIENIWDGQPLSAYNFETKEMENINVNYEKLKDFDYNAMIGTMILQYNMRYFDYNIPQALLAYNMGTSRVDGFGDNWNTARLSCERGNPMYLEHVFSYLPDGCYLSMKKPDGGTSNCIIDNSGSNIYEYSTTK